MCGCGTLSSTRQFLRSSGIMTVLYAGSTGLSFLAGIILARLLGAGGYGVYALALTTATLVGMLTEFGLPVLLMREVGAARSTGNWGSVRGLLNWSDRAILGLSIFLIAATLVGYALFGAEGSSDYLASLLWSVLLIPFVALGKLRSFALLALDRVAASQFPVMILRPALFLAVCAALYWSLGDLTPSMAMAAQVAGAAIASGVMFLLYRNGRPPELKQAAPVHAVGTWLSAAVPMGMTEGLRLLQGQLGLLLAGALAGTAHAGLYRVADAIVMVTAVVGSVAGTAATPMFSRLWKAGDRAGIERVALLAALAMTGGAFLLGLPIAIAGDRIIPWVFGDEFAGSSPVFLILWAGLTLNSTLGLSLALANMIGRHVLATQSFVLIAIVNTIAATLLVPRYGAIGAAISSVTGLMTGTLFCAASLLAKEGLNPTIFNRTALLDAVHSLRSLRLPRKQPVKIHSEGSGT